MKLNRWIRLETVLMMGIVLSAGGYLAAQAPAPPKVSSFAPAADLVAQVNYFVERIDEALADQAEYTEAKQSRVAKDASTLAVLALTLNNHDTEHSLKAATIPLAKAARALAEASADYAKAQKGAADVKAALAIQGPAAKPAGWVKVASMEQLMKQVPLLNSSLKRGALPARFEAQAEQNAGLSASLAAIAQAAMADTHEVKNPADMNKWYAYCAEFRDAAGEVNAAIHAMDQAATAKAMKRMSASCDTCHETFRPEEVE